MDEETILVEDNLISTNSYNALSANQGRVLNEKIEDVKTTIQNIATNEDIDAIFTE